MKEGVELYFLEPLLPQSLLTLLTQHVHHPVYLLPVPLPELQAAMSLSIMHHIGKCYPIRRQDATVLVYVDHVHAQGAGNAAGVLPSCTSKTS